MIPFTPSNDGSPLSGTAKRTKKLLIEFHEIKHWPERLHFTDIIPPILTAAAVPTGRELLLPFLEYVFKYFLSQKTKIARSESAN